MTRNRDHLIRENELKISELESKASNNKEIVLLRIKVRELNKEFQSRDDTMCKRDHITRKNELKMSEIESKASKYEESESKLDCLKLDIRSLQKECNEKGLSRKNTKMNLINHIKIIIPIY